MGGIFGKSPEVWTRIAQLTDHPPKWTYTLWKDIVLKISKSTEPFLWVACELSNSRLKSINFIAIFKIFIFNIFNISSKFSKKSLKVWSRIAQLSDHPPKWGYILLKDIVLRLSKRTKPFMSNLRLKLTNFIAILKIVIFNILSEFSKKSLEVWPRIAQLTDHPPKWAYTLCKDIVLRISKSTKPFLWVSCEPSYWRFNFP